MGCYFQGGVQHLSMGIIIDTPWKDENKGAEMVDILSHLHQYVPIKQHGMVVYTYQVWSMSPVRM